MSRTPNWTFDEYCVALDKLQHAIQHLAGQYADKMSRPEAVIHFASRQLLLGLWHQVQNEAEYTFIGKSLDVVA